jgi:hypothetical protein
LAVGVDEAQKRLVVVSADADARSAALAQADIQAAVGDYGVIVARPMIVSAGHAVSAITQSADTQRLSMRALELFPGPDLTQGSLDRERFQASFQTHFSGVADLIDRWTRNSSSVGGPPFLQVLKQVIDQISLMRVEYLEDDVVIDFSRAIESSPELMDAQLGICGFPLYAMTDADLDAFLDPCELDVAQDVLQRHGVMQFFFPAPDQLLLGAIDRGAPISSPEQPALMARGLGHPPGKMELVPTDTSLPHLLDALRERKLVVSGEVSVELSDEGRRERTTVKFTPRESVLSKIINRISLNIDLRQMFGIQLGSTSRKSRKPEG